MRKKIFLFGCAIVVIIGLASIFIGILPAIRLVGGGTLVLFLPGLLWSYIFWPRNSIEHTERTFMSMALSLVFVFFDIIAITRLAIFVYSPNMIILSALIAVVIPIVILLLLRKKPVRHY